MSANNNAQFDANCMHVIVQLGDLVALSPIYSELIWSCFEFVVLT